MKNPGSLSGDGKNLRKDTTLRILRVVGDEVGMDQMVINLFDYASPNPQELHDNWEYRDSKALVYPHIKAKSYRAILYAYGDIYPTCSADYLDRIASVRDRFKALTEIVIPKTKAGYPVHPMNWQRHRLLPEVIAAIKEHKK